MMSGQFLANFCVWKEYLQTIYSQMNQCVLMGNVSQMRA